MTMRPDERRQSSERGVSDGLLVGLIGFLLGLTVLVWAATGLAGLLSHGAWPQGVTFTRTPEALRHLVTEPRDVPGAWPQTPAAQLSGWGLFWGLFIGQLMILFVMTIFVVGTLARWKAVRATRRATRAQAPHEVPVPVQRTEEPRPEPEKTPELEKAQEPVEMAVEETPPAPPKVLSKPPMATDGKRVDGWKQSSTAPQTPAPSPRPKPSRTPRAPPSSSPPTPPSGRRPRTPEPNSAPSSSTTPPTSATPRPASTGPHHRLRGQTHRSRKSDRAPHPGPPDREDRPDHHRDRGNTPPQLPPRRRHRRPHHPPRTPLGTGHPRPGSRPHPPHQPQSSPGAAGELEAALTAHPERRDIAQELTIRALAALSTVNIREACTANRSDALSLDSFIDEGGTLYVVGEPIEDPRTNPGAMPLLTALAASVVERGRRMAERSSSGRLDPPLTLVLDDVAAVAPLPQLPELLTTGADRGMPTLALLRSREQLRARWPHHDLRL